MEAFLFCREHTTLEIRTIWRARNGKVTSHSTLREGETRNHVGFRMLDQASGHCNIGAIKKVRGPAQYIFSKQEADHVESLLVKLWSEPKQHRPSDSLPEKELSK